MYPGSINLNLNRILCSVYQVCFLSVCNTAELKWDVLFLIQTKGIVRSLMNYELDVVGEMLGFGTAFGRAVKT